MRGCLIAFLCKSQTWNKVTDLAPGQLPGPTNGPNGPRSDPEYAGAAKPTAKAAPKPAAKNRPCRRARAGVRRAAPQLSSAA